MKQGWEIKNLGEVCEVVGGSTPKTSEESYWGGEYYWISPAELDGSKYVYSTSRTITNEGVRSAHLRELPIGTVLLSSRAPIGKVAITKVPMFCNQGFKNLICKEEVFNEYVYRFLLYSTDYLNSLGTGATFKEISKKVVEQIPIPVPPLPVQEKIVAELDCLSGVIEKKKEQLKGLDSLAQSIFYTMFGDPITNEKGWEVLPLKKATLLKAGKAIKANELSESSDLGLYPCYGGNGIRGYIYKQSHNGQFPIIGRQGALCGNVVFAKGEFYATEHAVVCNNIIDSINPLWLYYALKYNNLNRYAQGVAQPGISVNIINEMPLIYPPLPLQQEFASKIEAIEKQKELIKESIKETETLFNARMQYYFG